MSRILIVDDDRALCRSLQLQLAGENHESRLAYTASEGLQASIDWKPDLTILDFNLPDEHGLQTLPKLLAGDPAGVVVIMTGDHDTRNAIEAMARGAADYLRKPFDFDDVLLAIEKYRQGPRRAAERSEESEHADERVARSQMVGTNRKILEVIRQIGLLSRSRVPVFIQGESGTGKELAARMLHGAACPRERFVAINCSAVVPTLMESELFGHEKGSFTGADQRKTGKLEYAGGGTVFLDEIGDLPLALQGKLLRVLQEEEFVRVGGLEPIRLKARILSASNRDLEEQVRVGAFRKDLYYRVAVSTIQLPPLRERRGDIPLVVDYILARVTRKLHRTVNAISGDALARLVEYDWPGNVRELENVLTRAIVLSNGPEITIGDLEFSLVRPGGDRDPGACLKTLAEAENEHIAKALAVNGWNITKTAQRLEISPTTLRKKIADYGLRSGGSRLAGP